jgi:uncharacterized damage-inducible protein DinB
MTDINIDPRYPIGKYQPQPFSQKQLQDWLNDIKSLPTTLEFAVQDLDESQYNTPYREGGWTIKQVVHHLADSHINAYTRFKLGLTEDAPQIKPYLEKQWAEMNDVQNLPANISITLLHALHTRLYEAIKDLKKEDWDKTVYHPEHKKEITLWHLLGMYSWHGRHHVAHITTARKNYNWR